MQADNSSLWNWKNALWALSWWPRIWFSHSRHAVESICSTCQYLTWWCGTSRSNSCKHCKIIVCCVSWEQGNPQELKRASLSAQNNWKLLYMLGVCMCRCFCSERSRKQVKRMRRTYIAVSSYFCIHLESGVRSPSNTNQSSHTET